MDIERPDRARYYNREKETKNRTTFLNLSNTYWLAENARFPIRIITLSF